MRLEDFEQSAVLAQGRLFYFISKRFHIIGKLLTVEQFDTPVEPADFAAQFGFEKTVFVPRRIKFVDKFRRIKNKYIA